MINLIPPIGRTALRHEYMLRVGAVCGFFLAGVLLAFTALIAPTYVLTSSQLTAAENVSSEIEKTKQAFEIAFGEIKVANTVMAQLRKEPDNIAFSEVIEEVVKRVPSQVSLNSFVATREGVHLRELRVQGNAESRIALATFKQNLENSPYFSQAFVPISDLARDTDLSSVVTLTLKGGDEMSSKNSP